MNAVSDFIWTKCQRKVIRERGLVKRERMKESDIREERDRRRENKRGERRGRVKFLNFFLVDKQVPSECSRPRRHSTKVN